MTARRSPLCGLLIGVVVFCAGIDVGVAGEEAAPTDSLPSLEPLDDIPGLVEALAPFILPKVLGDIWLLKHYICSAEFVSFKTHFGDRFAVDAIFRRAQILSWNNRFESLLITFFASMDHRNVGFHLPVVGPIIWFPLTSEFPDEYHARVSALPVHLVPDSPATPGGDRDKLQHFFGSALLAYISETAEVIDQVGPFVERGEAQFVVGGTADERDQAANVRGAAFGYRLLMDRTCRPSEFLRRPLADDHDELHHVLPEVHP